MTDKLLLRLSALGLVISLLLTLFAPGAIVLTNKSLGWRAPIDAFYAASGLLAVGILGIWAFVYCWISVKYEISNARRRFLAWFALSLMFLFAWALVVLHLITFEGEDGRQILEISLSLAVFLLLAGVGWSWNDLVASQKNQTS